MSSLTARIVFMAVLLLMLPFSEGILTAQSIPDQTNPGQDSSQHTISFSFGDYDVISSIYVFLSSGDQQATCTMEITSIRKRSGLGWLLPSPISLDLLFRSAINRHHTQGHIPCNFASEEISLKATLGQQQGLASLLFTLSSLLHLNDQWQYSLECQEEEPLLISLIDFIGDTLFN